jgi:putative oxidoreductase
LIGFAARFAAIVLLVMTAVITYLQPATWPTQGTWAACFLLVVAGGAGALSLDYLIARRHG